MKLALLTFIFLTVTANAQASDISACANDEYTKERIQEQINEVQKDTTGTQDHVLLMKDEQGTVTGVLFGSEGEEFYSAYLCGRNSGYYYFEGLLEDVKKGQFKMYNDEYDGSIKGFKVDQNTNSASFDLTIQWGGESEEDADYQTFTQKVWLDLTPVTDLNLKF